MLNGLSPGIDLNAADSAKFVALVKRGPCEGPGVREAAVRAAPLSCEAAV